MAHVSEDITESFISESTDLLDSIRKDVVNLKATPDDKEILARLLRDVHTIKGNARMLGYNTIEKLAHAVEDVYKSVKDEKIKNSDRLIQVIFYTCDKIQECINTVQKKSNDSLNIDLYILYCDKLAAGELIDTAQLAQEVQKEKMDSALKSQAQEDEEETISDLQSIRIKLDRINEIISSFDNMIIREFRLKHQLDNLRQIEESTGNHDISRIRKQLENDIVALETSIFSVQQSVFDLRMLPILMAIRPLENTVVVDSINLGKNVRFEIPDTEIAIDKVVLEQLSDILMHLIRNSLDHGIETPQEREAAGKPEQGVISIKCVQETKYIELTVSDDGRGIDYDKIRQKALTLYPERTDEIKDMSEKELSSFLFLSGFSTKETVTELSGRGVGLDVVWNNIEKIKGHIHIESEKNKGTSFILRFPISLATLQGLFIFSNKSKYLIPSQHIIDIIYRKKSEYITLQNQSYIKLESNLIPVYALSSLFKDQHFVKASDADTILIAEYMEQQIGIVVDQVQRYASLVVKQLPNALKNFTILQGIVFDEHYDIVPILHVPEIITKFKSLRGYDIKKYEAKIKSKIYRVLIVDDSDTTRQVEKTILEGNEFMVDTAVDGIDGLEKIKAKQYDLILSDKDMPRMNGLVLLDNIRHLENYASIPVIIVSADQSPETINTFKKAGANAFIAKADFKRGNLINVIKELLHE
ncbi:MAG: response regulator [Treponema sp.]|nr:response regulator [Treponema sp.]